METTEAQVPGWDYYIHGVLAGIIPACTKIRKACERHIRDLERSKEPDFPYVFSPAHAKYIISFFCRLQLTKGLPYPGKRFEPAPWQQFILAMLFGWIQKSDKLRRFRKGHIMVPRKNGKSHLLAGIGLFCLLKDNEMGAEVYSVATKKDQAKIIWDAAVEFRRHSGDMAQHVDKSVNALFVRETGSKFQALASEEDGLDGLNVHLGLVDELQNHKTSLVYERIDTGRVSRRQPMILSIATAGTDPESPCGKERNYAANVLTEDFVDETYFAFLAEADPKGLSQDGRLEYDWENPDLWRQCNPNYGVSVREDYLAEQCRAAKNEPAKLNAFLRLHLNIWTSQDHVWMPMDRWRACVFQVRRKVEDDKTGEVSWADVDGRSKAAVEDAMLSQWRLPFAGLDLSERGDITALALLFPPSEWDERWVAQGYYWVPDDCIEKRAKKDRVPYDAWTRDGLVYKTAGVVVDYDVVKAEIMRLHHKLHMQGLAVDPHNALMLNNQLRGEGVPVVEVQQGWKSLSDPTKDLMAWTLSRKINNLNDPVMNWMMGNVAVHTDAAGNIRPDKAKARERIDGVAALVNAMHLALTRAYSVYSGRGIITI